MSDVKKDSHAFDLFVGAVPVDEIAKSLGFRSVVQAQAAVRRELARREKQRDLEVLASVEVARLDRLYEKAFALAVDGDDVGAIDRCLKISEQRLRLVPSLVGRVGGLEAAYDASVASIEGLDDGVDGAAVEAGRVVARQIDSAITHGTGQEVTKALYLLPHLMNVLRELGATPAARSVLSKAAKNAQQVEPVVPVSDLDKQRLKYARK